MSLISSIPKEINNDIFFKYLDEHSQLVLILTNKKISKFISENLLTLLRIPFKEGEDSSIKLLQYFQLYCKFFRRKVPENFLLESFRTLADVKKFINVKLAECSSHSNVPVVDEVWSGCMYRLNSSKISQDVSLENEKEKVNKKVLFIKFNTEIGLLLRAGAGSNHPIELASIINKKWCSQENIKLIVDRCFNSIDDFYFEPVLQEIPSSLKYLVEENIYQIGNILRIRPGSIEAALKTKFSENLVSKLLNKCHEDLELSNIRLALENKYSDDLILRIFEKCSKAIGRDHIYLAIENKSSANLILSLLDKCADGISETHITLALSELYSAQFIFQLLKKLNAKSEDEKINVDTIRMALKQGYADSCISMLMGKVKTSDILKSLEMLIELGSYPALIEKYLHKAVGVFNPNFNNLMKHGYSEDVFLELFARSNQNKSVRKISLLPVMQEYSVDTVELLINGGVPVTDELLNEALNLFYPESDLEMLIDHMTRVLPNTILKAKHLNYSDEIIRKMKEKSPFRCVIM